MYLQLDSMVEEIKQSLQKALIYVEHLQLQLNMFEYRQAVTKYNIPTQVMRPFGRHTDQNFCTTQVAGGPKSRSLAFL